jgi:predicted permease
MRNWDEAIRKQLAPLHLGSKRELQITEELKQYAEDRYHDLIAAGEEEADARRIVLNELTASDLLAAELRAVEHTNVSEPVTLGAGSRGNLFSGLGRDIRYAFRTLCKNLKFTTIAMLTLALGIGANTAIFSIVNSVLLQPLGYSDAGRLIKIYASTRDFSSASVAYPNYLDWRRESRSFTDMGAFRSDSFNFTGAGVPEQISGDYVTASLFPMLGVTPVLGRTFLPEEDRPGTGCMVMLSYGLWQRRFAGDANILGKSLTLNADSCTIVGVLPATFHLRDSAQVFMPIEQWTFVDLRNRAATEGLNVIGRLKPGVSMQAAQSEMISISKELAHVYPKTNASQSARLFSMKDDMVSSVRPTLLMLAGAVGFVLIIACANVANLMLARSTARKREFAIRVALGADRWRIVRQLLTESLMLSLGAAVIGLMLAYGGTRAVLAVIPGSLPRAGEIGIDPYVLLFALAVAVITGIVFGMAPAIHGANARPQDSLKDGARGVGGSRHRSESVFVGMEVTLAVILLAGAGLMIQSVWRLLRVDPGFNVHNILTMQVALTPKVMSSPSGIRQAYQQMMTRVEAVPGVKSAAITSMVPLSEGDSEIPFWPGTGPQPPQEQMGSAMSYIVTADYSKVMQIPLRRGRFINDHDTIGTPTVAVIDEVMAQKLYPGQDPIGRTISLDGLGPVQIVGVVGHVKQWGLDSDDTSTVRNQLYFPLQQVPDQFMSGGVAGLTLVLRTDPEPLSLLAAVRAQVAGPTLDQPVFGAQTMEQVIAGSVTARRFTLFVLVLFAGIALLLAAVGIYGVMSYVVERRTQEIGIRAALGASRQQILTLVLRQGMRPVVLGMAGGLIAAFALTRVMTRLLYGVRPMDPLTLLVVSLLLGGIALFACYIPARRATLINPTVALRTE